jgi:hypothetical protein
LPAPDFLPPGSSLSLTPSCCSIFVTALGPAHASQTPGGAAEKRRTTVQARARPVCASPLDCTAPPRAGPAQRYLGSGMPSSGVSIAAAGTAAESRKSTSTTPSGHRAAPCAVRELRMTGNILSSPPIPPVHHDHARDASLRRNLGPLESTNVKFLWTGGRCMCTSEAASQGDQADPNHQCVSESFRDRSRLTCIREYH